MITTMNLYEKAMAVEPSGKAWADTLGIARSAMATAKTRGHLSPALAGALAEKLGEDIDSWIVIAALESERDSACKERMMKRVKERFKS